MSRAGLEPFRFDVLCSTRWLTALHATAADILLSSDLTSAQYVESDVLALRDWRRNIAHEFQYFDVNGHRSLSSRVCEKDAGLHLSTTQAQSFTLIKAYLGDEPGRDLQHGTLMCMISLFVWFLNCSKELVSAIAFARAMWHVPAGPSTEIELRDGQYTFLQLSRVRGTVIMAVSAARFTIVTVMMYAGTLFLGYTIELSRLLLQTVVLGFVMTIDELMYTALAPEPVKKACQQTTSFPIPKVPWWRSVLTVTVVLTAMSSAMGVIVLPQTSILKDAFDALCAGDTQFVRTTDGVGTMVWGFPSFQQQDVSDVPLSSRRRKWIPILPYDSPKPRTFGQFILDRVLEGNGRGACPRSLCYNDSTAIPSPLKVQADCCLARQTSAPDVLTGTFSVKTKATEPVSEATDL